MPALITTEEAKAHARIDHDIEDALIASLVAAAIEYVKQATNAKELDSTGPPMAKAAALMVFADLYDNRAAQTDRPIIKNTAVDSLLAMCRDYKGFIA